MLKTFYVQIDESKTITDVIEYPYEDYIQVQWNTPLPDRIIAREYELIDGQWKKKPQPEPNPNYVDPIEYINGFMEGLK